MDATNRDEVDEKETGGLGNVECTGSGEEEIDVDTLSCTSAAKASAVSQIDEEDKHSSSKSDSVQKDDRASLMAVSVAIKRSIKESNTESEAVSPGAVRVSPLGDDETIPKDDLVSEMAVSLAIDQSLSNNTPALTSQEEDDPDHMILLEDQSSQSQTAREEVPGVNFIDNSAQTLCSPQPERECDERPESGHTVSCSEETENAPSDAVHAYRVSDEVVHATPAPLEIVEEPKIEDEPPPANRNPGLTMAIYIATGGVVLIAAIILALVFLSDEDASTGEQHALGGNDPIITEPTSADIPKDCPDPSQEIFLIGLEDKVIEDIGRPCSPQAFANAWMLNDPFKWDYTGARLFQRFILVSAFYAFGGPHLDPPASKEWLSYDVSECLWGYPMRDENICNEYNVMNVLNLTKTGLSGTIPGEFLIHHKAKIVDVSDNNLYGGFPAIGDGVYELEVVNLANNNLTGWFHFETDPSKPFARLERPMALQKLELQNNPIKVSFADFLPGALPNLTYFDIGNNQIYGRIPKGIFQYIGKLEVAKMANNDFQGLIDPSLATLPNLRQLDMSGNTNLLGTIPGPFPSLEYLDLRNTRVVGPIPTGLCERARKGELVIHLDNCGADGWSDCCTGTRNLLRSSEA